MEPTPIFATLAAPAARGDVRGGRRRTVPEILRALRAEQDTVRPVARGGVGHVPGLLSFRASPND